MARYRVIKPEFWEDEKLGTVSMQARLIFIGLWTNSDDYGVVKGNATLLKNRIFPYDEIKKGEFEKWLAELEREDVRVIIPFMHNGEKFYFIKHFKDHQRVDKPSKSNYPDPPKDILDALPNDSRDNRDTLATPSRDSSDQEEVVEEEEFKRIKEKRRGKKAANPISRINFEEWPEYVKTSFDQVLADEAWITLQEKKYPSVDIKKTISEEFEYWSSDEGFEKREGNINCNWKSMLYRAFKTSWRGVPKRPDGRGKTVAEQKEALLDY